MQARAEAASILPHWGQFFHTPHGSVTAHPPPCIRLLASRLALAPVRARRFWIVPRPAASGRRGPGATPPWARSPSGYARGSRRPSSPQEADALVADHWATV